MKKGQVIHFTLACFFYLVPFSVDGAITSQATSDSSQIKIAPPLQPSPSSPTAPATPSTSAAKTTSHTTTGSPSHSEVTKGHSIESSKEVVNPGIVAYRDGKRLWSDHLLNLSSNIDIDVEITKPDFVHVPITTEELKAIVSKVFQESGITPEADHLPGKAALPSFQILIFVYPFKGGFACSISGRLFEAVTVDRIKLDDTVTMQAVTWDRSSIHVVSTSKLKEELEESVKDIATDFTERYKFFQKYKNSQ